MNSFYFNTYLSPFTWRYGSSQMRAIWSEVNKRKLWRKLWVTLAKAQYKHGLVSKKELDDLIKHQQDVDIEKAHEIEKEIHHHLMAEIKTYASQAKIGGGKIHLGATSMDIEDNAETIRCIESLKVVKQKLFELLRTFAYKIEKYKETPCMAYTHLQPAEPTTLGYRFAFYAQDILFDLQHLSFVFTMLKGKGIKGAVGTSASYVSLLTEEKAEQLEKDVMKSLGIDPVTITNQTSPRKLDMFVAMLLSSIAQTIYKFCFDVRIMQSPGFSEWQEPFGEKQVGSSAMPFKRNPWKSESICSLGKLVFHLSNVARDNAASMLLERTLDDSANRRVYIPEMFLAVDEMLIGSTKIIEKLTINEKNIAKNLNTHGPFSAIEVILMTVVKRGGNRQEMHEILREHALSAYTTMQEKDFNPLSRLLKTDIKITKFIKKTEIDGLLNPAKHVGLAEKKCKEFLKKIKHEFSD